MMERSLSAFLHGAARRLAGRQPRRGRDGEWHYPSLEGAMEEAGLTDIRTSIHRRQNTVAQYIATRPLLDLCEGARPREGARVTLRWWEKSGIYWGKAKAKGTETETTSGSETGQTRRGGRSGKKKSGQADQAGRNGAGQVRMIGHDGKLY